MDNQPPGSGIGGQQHPMARRQAAPVAGAHGEPDLSGARHPEHAARVLGEQYDPGPNLDVQPRADTQARVPITVDSATRPWQSTVATA